MSEIFPFRKKYSKSVGYVLTLRRQVTFLRCTLTEEKAQKLLEKILYVVYKNIPNFCADSSVGLHVRKVTSFGRDGRVYYRMLDLENSDSENPTLEY